MEARLFEIGAVPEWTTPEWYADREAAPHLEQEGHRERLLVGADLLRMAPAGWAAVDLGAGDGGFMTLLGDRERWGYDLSPDACIAAQARGENVSELDIVNDRDKVSLAPVVIMQETLEHLVGPHEYVSWLHSQGVKALLVSSPYTETKDSHYEFHTWAWDEQGYRAMLEAAGWRVGRQVLSWICQVVLCERAS